MVNKVTLIGNLGQDPEVKHFDSGSCNAKFSLATSQKRKNKEGDLETETQWHNVILWGKQAELAEKFLQKGSKVYVEGSIKYRSYDDKDGVTKYITEIMGFIVNFLDSKADGPAKSNEEAPAKTPKVEQEDDLPF
jgi:single-strand DNA-binding protein